MMPDKIGKVLSDHDVTHVADLGWQALRNGKLLAAAEAEGFEVLLTKDSNMPYQQNLSGRVISMVILKAFSQDFEDLVSLVPLILKLLPNLTPGSVARISH